MAHMMGLPHCTNVVKLEVGDDRKSLKVNRELEGGLNEVIELSAPAVLSIQSGINDPRYPTLPGIMKAKKKPLDGKTASDLGAETESQTEFLRMFFPVADHKAEIIEGDPAAAAGTLLEKLKNEARVI
jgi:electron transfer flavoprotein beta subunit